MKRSRRLAVIALLGLLAGCATGTAARSAKESSPPTTVRQDTFAVSSSIRAGAVLARATVWQADVTGPVGVAEVDFLIDGRTRWVEQHAPYEFNEGGLFAPWPLGPGQHTLALHAVSSSGATRDTSVTVTVPATRSAVPLPAGSYHRTVTAADAERVRAYRDGEHGAFGERTDLGDWTMRVGTDGVIVLDLTQPDGYDGFYLPYRATRRRLTLFGPAIWLQPHPDDGSRFCEPEPPASYRWTAHEGALTITPVDQSCADRDTALVGTWKRV